MKLCPRCSAELNINDKVCPKCKLEVSKMAEYAKNSGIIFDDDKEEISAQPSQKKTKNEKRQEKIDAKQAKKQAKLERKKLEEESNTDFSKFASNSEENKNKKRSNDTFSERRKNRKEKETIPQFELDENGEFNIDTSDVELVGNETGKIIEDEYNRSYSVKKARGDYREPKIKWWELYKWADRAFARRKIKSEVNKAAIQKPDFVSKSKLLLLAIFLGWTGAHNFYAKNKKKGWVSVVTLIIWFGIVIISQYTSALEVIAISVGGFSGFINVFIWLSDIISIVINKFKYRIQKEKFIFGMNIETRAKLGEKYIDLELYKKPWWVRFKVWCQKKKRDFEESKRERHQAKIEKQKRKLAKQEAQAKIDAEIAEFESKENAEFEKNDSIAETQNADNKTKVSKVIDKQTLREINSFDGGLTETQPEDKTKFTNNKKSKKSFKTKNKKK